MSGIAKLRAPGSASRALSDFGILRRPTPAHGIGVGVFEIALCVALASGAARPVVLGCATAILWFFVLLLSRQIATGRSTPCYCFGDAGSPLTVLTVLRTVALALVATAAAAFAPPDNHLSGAEAALQAVGAIAFLGAVSLGGQIRPAMARMAHRHGSIA